MICVQVSKARKGRPDLPEPAVSQDARARSVSRVRAVTRVPPDNPDLTGLREARVLSVRLDCLETRVYQERPEAKDPPASLEHRDSLATWVNLVIPVSVVQPEPVALMVN